MPDAVFEFAGRKHDPLAARRTLFLATGGRLREYAVAYNQPDESDAKYAAEAALVAAARKAFALPPIDADTGEGVTEESALATLRAFLGGLPSLSNAPSLAPGEGLPNG